MSIDAFNETRFRAKVDKALVAAKKVLDTTRLPQYAADVSHEYTDKYVLATFLTNAALASQLGVLAALGLDKKKLATVRGWATTRAVTLRLAATETCTFLRKVVREVKSDTTRVHESTLFGTSKSYSVTKVTEWFWKYECAYTLSAYQGTEVGAGEVLQHRVCSVELKTTADSSPKPERVVRDSRDVALTWLLQHIDADTLEPQFKINRESERCRTPRRNPEISAALSALQPIYSWCAGVSGYFLSTVFPVHPGDHELDLAAINATTLFVPVLPFFESGGDRGAAEKSKKKDDETNKDAAGSGVVPLSMFEPFQSEQARTLAEKFAALDKSLPAASSTQLISVAEAKIAVACQHWRVIAEAYGDGVNYIEHMLRTQLIAAIGKEVQPVDFAQYLRFHQRKLFKPQYRPRPFSYAIRRPDHFPEGTLSIECQLADGATPDPIATTVAVAGKSTAVRPMKFALDAATDVTFYGERYLHGQVLHQFSGRSDMSLTLAARARQFSSFILLAGRIVSATEFDPKHALIVENKDEVLIPLLLETIPTPKEFRDAIESLSPEQQRFAKAFRSMQLESTLFGVAVIQIKPQLERLLNLDSDSLTKEIALSQQLQKLFIEFQIPSDLISFDGDPRAPPSSKIARVRELANNMQAMIDKAKREQLGDAREKQQMRLATNDMLAMNTYGAPSASASSFGGLGGGGGGGGGGGAPGGARAMAPSRSAAPSRSGAGPGVQAAIEQPARGDSKPHEPKKADGDDKHPGILEADEAADYTKIPIKMEAKFDKLDTDSALRPTIINMGNSWQHKELKSLLADPTSSVWNVDRQKTAKQKAFDLLDALTKSGCLAVTDCAELHVVIVSTHCFDKTLMNTLVQDNVNPIEKVERSSLIVASCVHNVPATELIVDEQRERVTKYSPSLLLDADDDNDKKNDETNKK